MYCIEDNTKTAHPPLAAFTENSFPLNQFNNKRAYKWKYSRILGGKGNLPFKIIIKWYRDEPAVASETCTCWSPLGRWDGPCPTQPGRRLAVSAPARPGPSGAAPAVSVVHPPEQHGALPSPSPDAQTNGRSKLQIKTVLYFSKTVIGHLHYIADVIVCSCADCNIH